MCKKLIELPDEKMHLFTTMAASSSAIFYYLFNSILEAGVKNGLDEKTAKEITLNSAKSATAHALASESKLIELINNACTPNGMTIEGINHLQENNVGKHVETALQKILKKSKKINEVIQWNKMAP